MDNQDVNQSKRYTSVAADIFSNDIKSPDIFLIDVRTPEEFNSGHINGAHNLDVQSSDFVENAKLLLPTDKIIAVYCGTGKRSGIASSKLSDLGYKILNLEGGLNAWTIANLPIVK